MKLGRRLAAAASLVRPGIPVCDVGTDHGLLACFLAQKGISPLIVASDIAEKPLDAARNLIASLGLEGQVRTVLSDGLRDIPPDLAGEICILGMGGELIAEILQECPYAKEEKRHFILQPMTRANYLRKFLCEQGFSIEREIPVEEGVHVYTVMSVVYTGEKYIPSALFQTVGRIPESNFPDRETYLRRELIRIERICDGKCRSGQPYPEEEALAESLRELLK